MTSSCLKLINSPSPQNCATSLTTYTTHTRTSDKHIYIFINFIYIVQIRGKAIIGMAVQTIKNLNLHVLVIHNDLSSNVVIAIY